MNVNQFSHEQLDYWVARARCIALTPAAEGAGCLYTPHPGWAPSRYGSQGGPIIEAAHIDLNWDWESSRQWSASMDPHINTQGGTVLEAAMRAYVISQLGDEIG